MNKTPTPKKALSPEKTPSPDKALSPEKTLSLDKVPTPEETLTPDKFPTLEETPTLEDKAPSPDRVFSVHEAQVPEVPSEDEAPGPKMAPPGDEAPTLGKVLTPMQASSEEASTRDNSQFQHFSLEEALTNARSLEASEAQSLEEVHMPEEHPLSGVKHPLDKEESSPLQSESQSKQGSMAALEKAHIREEATTFLEEPSAKYEAAPQKEETLKEERSPEEVTPADQTPQAITPQVTPTLHAWVLQNLTDSKRDRDDVMRLKDEVEALRRSLEQMGLQLE